MLALLVTAATLFGPLAADDTITLEVRVFAGAQEVTGETRISVHKAGDRQQPIAQLTPDTGRLEIQVQPGIYDVQAIREQDERVSGIRWAERLVVMAYPDERGHHLEVVNLAAGYGALQVRAGASGRIPDVSLFPPGERTRQAAPRYTGNGYALFVAPAGSYDVRVRSDGLDTWQTGVDVPLDRTRLLIVQ